MGNSCMCRRSRWASPVLRNRTALGRMQAGTLGRSRAYLPRAAAERALLHDGSPHHTARGHHNAETVGIVAYKLAQTMAANVIAHVKPYKLQRPSIPCKSLAPLPKSMLASAMSHDKITLTPWQKRTAHACIGAPCHGSTYNPTQLSMLEVYTAIASIAYYIQRKSSKYAV